MAKAEEREARIKARKHIARVLSSIIEDDELAERYGDLAPAVGDEIQRVKLALQKGKLPRELS